MPLAIARRQRLANCRRHIHPNNNASDNGGGAIYSTEGIVNIQNSCFINNTASDGVTGDIFNESESAVFARENYWEDGDPRVSDNVNIESAQP